MILQSNLEHVISQYVVSFSDINECDSNVCTHSCTDTDGSYFCSCFNGFKLNADKKTCTGMLTWGLGSGTQIFLFMNLKNRITDQRQQNA